jgi:hypothetical protein
LRDRDQLSLLQQVARDKVLVLNDNRATPALVVDDGKDFVPTNRWMAFGHHFAAIAGPARSSARSSPRSLVSCPEHCGFLSAQRWVAVFTT